MLVICSGLKPKGQYLSLEKGKETFCVVFTYSIKRAREVRKFRVAVVQRWLKMYKKACCFTNINLLLFFLPLSLPSLLSLPNVPFVVIQKFCYHGNLTSHFSSLFRQVNSSGESRPSYKGGGGGEGGGVVIQTLR